MRIPKLKTGDALIIEWLDSAYAEGPRAANDVPTPIPIRTFGLFVKETDEAITVSCEQYLSDDAYRYLHTILKINIQKIRKL